MDAIIKGLRAVNSSTSPLSRPRSVTLHKKDDSSWLQYSQIIAQKMLGKMEEQGLNQRELAERMNCTQQYVSKVLKGRENLSLETLYKIETALNFTIINGNTKK